MLNNLITPALFTVLALVGLFLSPVALSADAKKAEADEEAKKKTGTKSLLNKRGPHDGLLRSAGKFLTEIKTGKSGLEVYLTDAKGETPTVSRSRVEGQLYIGDKEYELRFTPYRNSRKFVAKWPANVKRGLDGDEVSLVLLPTRETIIGAPVLYKLKRLY